MGHKKSRCIKETHQCGTIFLSDRLGSEAFSLRSVASLWYTVMQSEEKEEYIPMVDELRHAFELAQQQPEGMQRYIAELVTHLDDGLLAERRPGGGRGGRLRANDQVGGHARDLGQRAEV